MQDKFITFISIFLIAACGGSSTCEPDEESTSGLTGKDRIDGSSKVFPVSEAVAEEFNAIAPGVRVTVGVSGTGGGFKKFTRKVLDMDSDLNALHAGTYVRLQDKMTSNPKIVESAVSCLTISSNLERLGDLATNIAEEIIFMEEGEMVRHQIGDKRLTYRSAL